MPDNTNMNKDFSVNYKPAAQNKTQAVANADVPPTSKSTQKTNSILKMNLMLSAKSLQIIIKQIEVLNLKENWW